MSLQIPLTVDALRQAGKRVLVAGDNYDLVFVLKRSGTAVNLTGAKIWFTVKRSVAQTDSAADLQLDTDTPADISITDAANGQVTVYLKPSNTESLEGSWLYDLQVLLSGKVTTYAQGKIEFLPNVTRTTT